MHISIALIPGDGVGPEVVAAACDVLDAVARRFGHTVETTTQLMGGAALRAGKPALPPETLAALPGGAGDAAGRRRRSGVRSPAVEGTPRGRTARPSQRPRRVRQPAADAHLAGARGDRRRCKSEIARGADLLIVRELTGGLYFGEPRQIDREAGEAFNTMRYSVGEIDRIARVAFDAARKRRKQ